MTTKKTHIPQMSAMSRAQVIQEVLDIAMHLPSEKLASWYQYGLFIQSQPTWTFVKESEHDPYDAELAKEFDLWEEASDQDWMITEGMIKELV